MPYYMSIAASIKCFFLFNRYLGKVYVMLMGERASAERIAAYLFDVATVRMGSSNKSIECQAARRTGEALVALRPTFEIH